MSIDFQRPVSVDRSIIENRTLGLVDDDDVRAVRAFAQETWFRTPVETEDIPVFLAQQRGVGGRHVQTSLIARGPDATSGVRGDDNRLRQFWVRWRELMGFDHNSPGPRSVPDAPRRGTAPAETREASDS